MSALHSTITNAALKAQRPYVKSHQLEASTTFQRGALVAEVTGTQTNQQQTVSIGSGTPTSGNFTLTLFGTTLTVPYNSSAAALKTQLETIVGAGNVSTSGGALPGTGIVVTFTGRLAGLYVPVMTVTSGTLDAGTAACSITTANRAAGRLKAWNPARIADPTTALSVSATGSGGSFTATVHIITYTWVTAAGETKASIPTVLALTSGQQIRVAAINAAGTPDDATALNVYVDGVLCDQIAVASGAIAQTDIAAFDATHGLKPLPLSNTAFTATDGTWKLKGFTNLAASSNKFGEVFFGAQDSNALNTAGTFEAPVVIGAAEIALSDLSGISGYETLAIEQLGARIVSGSIADGDAVIAFGPQGA